MKLINVIIAVVLLIPQIAASEIKYFKNIDDFTGKDDSRVIVAGDNTDIHLIIQCMSEELRMLFHHEELIGNNNNQVKIAYKLGDNPPSEFNFSNLLNPSSLSFLGILNGNPTTNQLIKNDKSLLGRLQGQSELAIRIVDPFDNRQLTTIFTLDGFREQVMKLSCVPSHF